jgi:hypothetical protein
MSSSRCRVKAVSEARQDGAGVRLGDAQILARSPTHATQHYKRASGNLDRHDVPFFTAYVAGV